MLGRAAHCACVLHRHQLEMPGHYSHLAAFYEDKKGVLHAGPGRGGSLPPVYWLPSIHRYMYPEMKVSCFLTCLGMVMGSFLNDKEIMLQPRAEFCF